VPKFVQKYRAFLFNLVLTISFFFPILRQVTKIFKNIDYSRGVLLEEVGRVALYTEMLGLNDGSSTSMVHFSVYKNDFGYGDLFVSWLIPTVAYTCIYRVK